MRTGIWLIGARGSVAVTAMVGAIALRAGLVEPTGCVTELPQLRSPALPGWADLVFGGHDIVTTPVLKKAEALAAAGVCPAGWSPPSPTSWPRSRPTCGRCPRPATQAEHRRSGSRPTSQDFRQPARPGPGRRGQRVLHRAGRRAAPRAREPGRADRGPARAGGGAAAELAVRVRRLHRRLLVRRLHPVDRGPAARPGRAGRAAGRAVRRQRRQDRRDAGQVGARADVRDAQPAGAQSWSGINLLGGGDGANLAEPGRQRGQGRQQAAGARRDAGLPAGGHTAGSTTCADIGDFKTAWDLVTFEGFLGTGMRMEFTWHGCDSALAAPLVLDLARLTAAAHRAGRAGPLPRARLLLQGPARRRAVTRWPSSGPPWPRSRRSWPRRDDGAAA